MSDTATAPAATSGDNPVVILVDGLRAAADFIEQHPLLDVHHARIGRHVDDVDEFRELAAEIGAEPIQTGGYVHATRQFGPVELDVQTSALALREADNLTAFREAYAAMNPQPGPHSAYDMARRYALTERQTRIVLAEHFGAETAATVMVP